MKRILSATLSVVLMLSLFTASAWADMPMFTVGPDGRVYVVKNTPAPAETPAPTQAPTEQTAAPADTAAAPAEATPAPASAAKGAEAAFTRGYVTVPRGTVAYRSSSKAAPAGVFTEENVVYAVRADDEWLEAAFVNKNGSKKLAVVVYVAAADVTPKNEADNKALQIIYAVNNPPVYDGYPLPAIGFDESAAQAPAPEPTPAPEVTEAPAEPEPTEAPGEEKPEEPDPAEKTTDVRIAADANVTSAKDGEKIVLTVKAEGLSGAETYQWQRAKGTAYEDCGLSGAKTDKLSFTATKARLQYQYRCRVTDGENVYFSDPVRVTFVEETQPTEEPAPAELPAPDEEPASEEEEDAQPEVIVLADGNATVTAAVSQKTASSGTKVYYTATVSGVTGTATYQWQKSATGEGGWSNSAQAGSKTAKMTITATESLIDKYYRCVVTDDSGNSISNTVKVTWMDPPKVGAAVKPASVQEGSEAVFTGTTSGTAGEVTYQWQQRGEEETTWSAVKGESSQTPVLTLTASEETLSLSYRLRIKDDNGTWYSDPVQATLIPAAGVKAAVSQETASKGTKVYYTVEVSGAAGDVVYQWQKSADGETGWSNSAQSGNKTAKMTITGQQSLIDLYYRCRVRDDNGYWYSNVVKVAWMDPPVITAAADTATASDKQLVHFDAQITGAGANAKYRWMKSADGKTGWSYSYQSGYATEHMKLTATEDLLNWYYRLRVVDDNGTWYSNTVKVDYVDAPDITVSVNQKKAVQGDKVIFTAEVSGAHGTATYQWQKSANGTSGWSNSAQSGNKTAKMTITATESLLANWYRLCVKDEKGTWLSDVIKVDFVVAPVITANVSPAKAAKGMTVYYNASVSGTVGTAKYRWQKSADGQTWSNSSQNGYATPNMKLTASEDLLSYQYRLRVIDDNGIWYSNAVKAELVTAPAISVTTSQKTASQGTKVRYIATVTGAAGIPTYQWQKSADGENGWTNSSQSGNKTAEMTITGTKSLIDQYYRLQVTDDNGVWYSKTVKVTWMDPPVITVTASPDPARDGETVTFTADVSGTAGTVSWQWQRSASGTGSWSNTTLTGAATSKLSFESREDRLSYYYRVRVTDNNGTWYSSACKAGWMDGDAIGAGQCGASLRWTLDSDYVLTITCSGAMYDYAAGTAPWYAWHSNIRKVVLESGATTVGAWAMYNCTALTEVRLSNSLVTVEESAFDGCVNLESITY